MPDEIPEVTRTFQKALQKSVCDLYGLAIKSPDSTFSITVMGDDATKLVVVQVAIIETKDWGINATPVKLTNPETAGG